MTTMNRKARRMDNQQWRSIYEAEYDLDPVGTQANRVTIAARHAMDTTGRRHRVWVAALRRAAKSLAFAVENSIGPYDDDRASIRRAEDAMFAVID